MGAACGLLGVLVLLRGLSYAGESLSHALLPGAAIAVAVGAPAVGGAGAGRGGRGDPRGRPAAPARHRAGRLHRHRAAGRLRRRRDRALAVGHAARPGQPALRQHPRRRAGRRAARRGGAAARRWPSSWWPAGAWCWRRSTAPSRASSAPGRGCSTRCCWRASRSPWRSRCAASARCSCWRCCWRRPPPRGCSCPASRRCSGSRRSSGVASGIAGLYLSYHADLAAGPSIALVAIGLFVLALGVAPARRLVARPQARPTAA